MISFLYSNLFYSIMSLFGDMLSSNESIFKNPVALDPDFMPKLIPFREQESKYLATCIKPLFDRRSGRNLIIYGTPGIGKTVAVKHVFQELEEEAEDIIPIFINCWKHNTTYKVIVEICHQMNYMFTQNKKTDELFKIVREALNKKSVVLAFDEIDKCEDFDFLYMMLEELYRKTIFLITNYPEWASSLDQRIRSRLMPELLEFKKYSQSETFGILKERANFAFVPNCFSDSAVNKVADHTFKIGDIRSGLFLLKESATIAEDRSSKKVEDADVKQAISKMSSFKIKSSTDLEEDAKAILDIVKKNSGKKIGDLFKIYEEKGGKGVYKTFQRKISKLSDGKYISTKQVIGKDGNTTIVSYAANAKLDDFS